VDVKLAGYIEGKRVLFAVPISVLVIETEPAAAMSLIRSAPLPEEMMIL